MKFVAALDGRDIIRLENTIKDVVQEFLTSTEKYGPFNTTHEAYGVLKEEVDELWDACKKNDLSNMEKEAVQVAAMAIRLIVDSRRTKEVTL